MHTFPLTATRNFIKKSQYEQARTNSSEAVTQKCSVKKVLLKISQNSQENTCARVSYLIKLPTHPCNFIKKKYSGTVAFL